LAGQGYACGIHQHAGLDAKLVGESTYGFFDRVVIEFGKPGKTVRERA